MQSNATPPSSVEHSPLFKLPPELRDMIYEYTFNTATLARVTKEAGIPEPALLSTCKVIRKEAIAVFYHEMRLQFVIPSYDPTVLRLWDTKRMHLLNSYNLVPPGPISFHQGPRMWANLKLCFQLYHGRKLRTLLGASQPDGSNYIAEKVFIKGLFEVVKNMRGQPWEAVRNVLNMLRPGLVRIYYEWSG
jgi:hypothetical protein